MIKTIDEHTVKLYTNKLISLVETMDNFPHSARRQFVSKYNPDEFLKHKDSWVYIYLQDDEDIKGVILGSPIEGGVGTIIWLLVDEKYRNNQIGKQLLENAEETYRKNGAHKIKLTVPNLKAKNFYLKNGWIQEGEHPNHWWKINFWSMAKSL